MDEVGLMETTENTFLFESAQRCSFAFDCPKVGNLMKTSGEKYRVHCYPTPESIFTTCSPGRNTLAILSDIWVEIGLDNMSSCLYAFWLNVLWRKHGFLQYVTQWGICFHFRVFTCLSEFSNFEGHCLGWRWLECQNMPKYVGSSFINPFIHSVYVY